MKRGNTVRIRVFQIANFVFAILFSFAIASVFIKSFQMSRLLFAIAFAVTLVGGFSLLQHVLQEKTRKQIDHIFLGIAAVVFVAQLLCAYFLYAPPIHDLNYLNSAAKEFCLTGDRADLYQDLPERHQHYFAVYPNNHALLIWLMMVYRISYALTGTMSIAVPIFLNVIGLSISYHFLYRIAKMIFRNKVTPLFCAILGGLFSVFYTYTPYFYTDSSSMPLVMGAIYLFLKAMEQSTWKQWLPRLVACGVLVALGYKVKGSVVILVPAFLLYACCMGVRKNWKKATAFLSFVGIGAVICSGVLGAVPITDQEELQAYQFPTIHWIMMGLEGNGGYHEEDFFYTKQSGDYEQKKEADWIRLKERVQKMGAAGMIQHVREKLAYTWGDGTYYIKTYLRNGTPNALRNFVLHSRAFSDYCAIFHETMLFFLFLAFFSGICSDKIGAELLLKIILCGVFSFFLLWEARSRYLVNFTPVFLLLEGYSIERIWLILPKKNKKLYKNTYLTKGEGDDIIIKLSQESEGE